MEIANVALSTGLKLLHQNFLNSQMNVISGLFSIIKNDTVENNVWFYLFWGAFSPLPGAVTSPIFCTKQMWI